MKRTNIFKLISIIATSLLLFASCSAESEQELPLEEPNYYIKYEARFTTQHINTTKNIRFLTENGMNNKSFTEWTYTHSWEGTYGPVDKKFIAFLECNVPSYSYDSEIHARIYVSKEKEPFVIKAEGKGKYSLSLKAKIDF